MVTSSAHSGITTILDEGNKFVWVSGQGGNIQHYQEILDNLTNVTFDKLSLFPNPNNGYFQLQNSWNTSSEDLLLHIRNSSGQLVFQKQLSQSSSQEINVQHLPQGIYTVQLLSNDKISTEKLVLQ